MEDPQKLVEKVAQLARLQLAPGEHEKFSKQFSGLLENFAKLQKLDTSGVEPTVYPFDLRNVLRHDEPARACEKEELLRNAPARHEDFYKVPKVIEG